MAQIYTKSKKHKLRTPLTPQSFFCNIPQEKNKTIELFSFKNLYILFIFYKKDIPALKAFDSNAFSKS